MTHRPVAAGHAYLSRAAAARLVPESLLPAGDKVGLVLARDAVTGAECTHFGPADTLRSYLLLASAFGVEGTVSDDGCWVGEALPGFRLCVPGHPEQWLTEISAAAT